MQTIVLVGVPHSGDVERRLLRAGFFVLVQEDAAGALGVLRVLRVNGFVVDVRDAPAGGEILIDRLRESPAWHHLPVVVTGASPEQCERLAQQAFVSAIITARDGVADAIVAALRPLLQPNASRIDGAAAGRRAGEAAPEPTCPHERPPAQAPTTLRSGSASTILNRPTEWEPNGMGA